MAERRWLSALTGAIASVFAVSTALATGIVLWELRFAERFGHEIPDWIPLGSVYGAKAHDIIKGLDTEPKVDLTAAKVLTWRQLRQSPVNHYAWLRLAFIDIVEHDHLTADGLMALQHSYEVAPYDALTWRIKMGFETWPSLSPDLRAAVIDDLKVNWKTGRRRRAYMALPSQVVNPVGQAVLADTVQQLRTEERELRRQQESTAGD